MLPGLAAVVCYLWLLGFLMSPSQQQRSILEQQTSPHELQGHVHEELQGQLDKLEPHLLTDLVWSLCVLQQAKAPYLQRVLAPDFYTQIQDAEMVVNSENKPLPVKDFAASHLLHSEGTKPLPPGARRASATEPVCLQGPGD
ncbi:protein tbrg4 [Limosa lapponica baueri]|uniref:Protein tbrg4 n=1 Tax=Limosa lapponica baueri TaxID=1758121 RepID=A0A2I0T5T1_LIMLA|nr:protein tbrg4 [Limosa lapponica baueri]